MHSESLNTKHIADWSGVLTGHANEEKSDIDKTVSN